MCFMFLYICHIMNKLDPMPKLIKLTLLFLIASIYSVSAQGGFSHEIGVIVGPVAFQSDYGERNDLSTNAGNTGFGIGLVHYLNFSYRADCDCFNPDTYFNDHFKFRTELSYNRTKLNHFGKWVTPEKVANSVDAAQLKAMEGSTSVTNIGMQIEFYPWSIRDFTATTGSYGPFVSLGGQFSFYNPEVSSTLGKLSATTVHPKYWAPSDGKPHGYTNEGGSVWSIVSSVGTRYKLTPLSDLIIDLRAQYYYSNWVDGLNPDPAKYHENKANDWNIWLNFGYIYYLN
jgi:hypothetical protein